MQVFTQVTRAHITAKDLPCIIAYKANLKPNAHAVPLRAIHHDLLQLSLDLTQLYTMYTPETRFSEPQFSEILNLMNKLQLPFSYFTLYSDSI